jgi:hypothetical protein
VSGGKRKTEKADSRGGAFFLLPHCVLTSEAFRTAEPRAIKVLLALCSKHNGFNNGAIGLGFRELAEIIDSQNHKANSRALCQLIERGLVELARDYPRGQRLAREYRLTFVPTGATPATNDYLHWKQGDAGSRRQPPGRGNIRVAIASTRTAVSVVTVTTGRETSRCDDRNGVNGKPPILGPSSVVKAATHIGKPFEGLSKSASKYPLNNNGPISAAPNADELRRRVISVLDRAGRGSQGHLAALASVRPAALSKFLHNSGSLNEQARIRLTMALPKVAARVPEKEVA